MVSLNVAVVREAASFAIHTYQANPSQKKAESINTVFEITLQYHLRMFQLP
jgi:hypothetical protein